MAETMPSQALPTPQHEPDIRISVRQTFGFDCDLDVPAFSERTEHVPVVDDAYRFDRNTTLAILGGLRPQPAGADPGLPRHRKVDAHRAGRGEAQLAVHPRQPRQPHQPHRPRRQGRHRAPRRAAGHGVPRGDPAVGVPARVRARVRRVRRGPSRRDVRHPAGAGSGKQAHAPRPVEGPASASGVPSLRPRRTPSASGTPPGSTTAPSRSTRARWTGGASSRRSTT